MAIEAFPLSWPAGQKRSTRTKRSPFKTGFGAARKFLFAQLKNLGATGVVVSTNVPLRLDGMPRANQAPMGGEHGVAIYFTRKNEPFVFACDQYDRCCDNVYALGKTLEAMRGIERWGASDMLQRAFDGFKALASTSTEPWREALPVGPEAGLDEVESLYKRLIRVVHPDLAGGGNPVEFDRLTKARALAREEFAS